MDLANYLAVFLIIGLGLAHPSDFKRFSSKTCVIPASGSETIDDAPAIVKAFEECGKGGKIIFENTTYHVNSVMKTTGLQDCEVDLHGTLLWSENITYWLDHSMPVGYQNQSTVWFIGGDNVKFDGRGYGTLDGNGQVWTLAVTYSEHVSFTNVFVNNTGTQGTVQNTDGANTIYSSHITFRDWEVINGDDSISVKANSTDILIENCTFRDGLGISIGSIGQYDGIYETVERVVARNITLDNTDHAAYFKTWTGEQVGYPPNGGGGGLGVASDLLFEGFTGTVRGAPFSISQCTFLWSIRELYVLEVPDS
ncbi:hypothetical protein N7488_004607 [Penicillium malachiteum]|nr:hypothetical protein N7488_004607 [Penicillium malachiteum]